MMFHYIFQTRSPKKGRETTYIWIDVDKLQTKSRPHICHFFSREIFSTQIFLHRNSVKGVNQEALWASQPLPSWKWPGRSPPWGILVNLITLTLIGSHAQGRSVGWKRECWRVRLSESDHASSVVQNTKRIVHVFRVSVVIMMRFVATNVCVAIATKTKRLLKRNGQLTSTTTSMSLQAERRKHRHFSARH